MPPLAAPTRALPTSDRRAPQRDRTADTGPMFGRSFWCAYAANFAMTSAASLLFRYSDYVHLLDGTEWHLGLIVGVGMVGAVSMRLAQGVGIDLFGPRVIWLWSSALYVASCLGHLLVSSVDGPGVYALRIAFQTSLAGFFGSSIAFIAGRSSTARIAEVVGTLGTSGFVGQMTGTFLSDLLLGQSQIERLHVDRVFLLSAALGSAALVFAALATHGARRPLRRRQPPLWRIVRRYQPGLVLLMAAATGFGLTLPTIFVRPFLEQLQIEGTRNFFLFFVLYSSTALVTRLSIRRLPERIGIRAMIYWGMAHLVAGMLSFLLVRSSWHLIVPAVLSGIAHALLFPAVVAGTSGRFPPRFRGIGTTLVLALCDTGTLVGSPLAGGILEAAGRAGWPRYPTMFTCVAILLAGCTLVYALAGKGCGKRKRRRQPVSTQRVTISQAACGAATGDVA